LAHFFRYRQLIRVVADAANCRCEAEEQTAITY